MQIPSLNWLAKRTEENVKQEKPQAIGMSLGLNIECPRKG
jgi:hypothetical protein